MVKSERYTSHTKRDWKQGERSKISLMQAFRSAHSDHDATKITDRGKDGEIKITVRSKQRREGVSDEALRAHLMQDLETLLNTVQLDAIEPLDDVPYVKASLLNFGFPDFSTYTRKELAKPHVVAKIRQVLLDFEPRLRGATLDIRVENPEYGSNKRPRIHVSAEMMNDPVDIPVDFEAEVDLGVGKLSMPQLRTQS